jgi:hypothetical protein
MDGKFKRDMPGLTSGQRHEFIGYKDMGFTLKRPVF